MKQLSLWMTLLISTATLFGCSSNVKESAAEIELAVSAAASLTEALTELTTAYEKDNEGITFRLNFASSRKLATQIEQGAPADVFLSASSDDVWRLKENGMLIESSIVDFAENSLVLISNNEKSNPVSSFEQLKLASFNHLSIGEPDTVPAGKYTKEVLEHLGLWLSVQDKLVMGSDVRQVLTHVVMGNADYGIVYASDAFISDKVIVVAEAELTAHSPIIYPGAVVKESDYQEEAQDFLDYVASEKGRAVLQKYGFQ